MAAGWGSPSDIRAWRGGALDGSCLCAAPRALVQLPWAAVSNVIFEVLDCQRCALFCRTFFKKEKKKLESGLHSPVVPIVLQDEAVGGNRTGLVDVPALAAAL